MNESFDFSLVPYTFGLCAPDSTGTCSGKEGFSADYES